MFQCVSVFGRNRPQSQGKILAHCRTSPRSCWQSQLLCIGNRTATHSRWDEQCSTSRWRRCPQGVFFVTAVCGHFWRSVLPNTRNTRLALSTSFHALSNGPPHLGAKKRSLQPSVVIGCSYGHHPLPETCSFSLFPTKAPLFHISPFRPSNFQLNRFKARSSHFVFGAPKNSSP